MDKNIVKEMIIELLKEGAIRLEVDTRRDWSYENWNNEYKIITDVKLVADEDIIISEANDYVTIEKPKVVNND